MKRRQLWEWEDLPFLPEAVRDSVTDYLSFLEALVRPYEPAIPELNRLLQQTGDSEILDLCSGAGGPLPGLVPQMKAHSGRPPSVCCSDLYPNRVAGIRLFAERGFRYFDRSLDATAVPAELRGVRTMFTAFHHFSPERAVAVLQNAVESRAPIAIFEITERSIGSMLRVALLSLALFPLTPFLRPQKLSRYILTFLIPLIPLVVFWDGIASSFRSYTEDELLELGKSTGDYRWTAGTRRSRLGARMTFLVGVPPEVDAASRVSVLSRAGM